ncbi:MAG TPA: mechanosensitive ion channel [Bacteroidia bacterium]|nr:mechanosensitive ion channel [Bacteroidia bacterium]
MEQWFSDEILNRTFLGNTVSTYMILVGLILLGFIFKQLISKLFSFFLFKLVKRYSGGVTAEELHNLLKKPFSLFLLLIIGFIAFNQIDFPPAWKIGPEDKFGVRMFINKSYAMLLIFAITWIFLRMVDFFGLILTYKASQTESKLDDQLIPFFKDGIKIFIVILSFFFILAAVFNVNIVTLIGGLGIGGLAVALAAKETLENLFGSFTIFLDKPFIVGDQVKIGNVTGHVETIGLRSTRIRTLEKSLVTVPNKKMVDAELENITLRTMWRTRQSINLVYQTAASDLQKITALLKSYLDSHSQIVEGSIVRFENLNSSSIDILMVYLVRTSEVEEYLKVKEEINFKIIEVVRAHNSEFAFPSTSVYMEKTSKP